MNTCPSGSRQTDVRALLLRWQLGTASELGIIRPSELPLCHLIRLLRKEEGKGIERASEEQKQLGIESQRDHA